MDRVNQLVVDNTLNVKINCEVDQQIIAKNFSIIMACLKELKNNQEAMLLRQKESNSWREKLEQQLKQVQKGRQNGVQLNNQQSHANTHVDHTNSNISLEELAKRVTKNETNIMDNIKDINLLNKDMSQAKKDIEELKKMKLGSQQESKNQTPHNTYGLNEIAQNMNNQMSKYQEKSKDLENRLAKAEEYISRVDKQLQDLKNNLNNSNTHQTVTDNTHNLDSKALEDLKRDLKDKLDILNKKVSNLQSDSNQHDKDIAFLKESLEQFKSENNDSNGDKDNQGLNQKIEDLKNKVEENDKNHRKDIKKINDEVSDLKQQLKNNKNNDKSDSKTNIEENKFSNRKSTIDNQLLDKINDLTQRVIYLEKILNSKNSFNIDDKNNPEKLPHIHKPRRDFTKTGFQEKGVSRKDINQLKSELQLWIKGYLGVNKDKEAMEDLELKIQDIRRNLDKKADAEGTKKGFAFLENKITQLYLFLTQPETEDAMIVRKGFNCLSCSKKVEKLRGRIGPKLNWNNMTTTNYSPPRVGYSKPMGQNSIDKEDDL